MSKDKNTSTTSTKQPANGEKKWTGLGAVSTIPPKPTTKPAGTKSDGKS